MADDDDDDEMPMPMPMASAKPSIVDTDSREGALRAELVGVRQVNTVIEGVVASLEKAKENMETVSSTVASANTLLDLWIRILSQTEHTQRLLLSGHWQGATQDLHDIDAESTHQAREAERRRQHERERAEEREREAEAAAARREAAERKPPPTRGTRGYRGTRRTGSSGSRGGGSRIVPPASGTGSRGGSESRAPAGTGIGRGVGGMRGRRV
ncbi:hypothetical protein Q9L58_007214 [Maublancomyces gigas]|uniref:DASH complex subunit DUO1 n=1 Tax=Discina gigas TaxID=1032678 RepID=A0ABR3GDA7_9PEZI